MAGDMMDRSNPWWSEGAAERPEADRARRGQRRLAFDRREAKHVLLQSARDTLERAGPLVGAMRVQADDSAAVAVTQARIAAALFEVDRLQATLPAASVVECKPSIATIEPIGDRRDGARGTRKKIAEM